MIKGVNKKEESIIKNILAPYQEDYDFYYYGSRVKGNFEKASDLDVLIKGSEKMPYNKLETLKVLFDQSDLPYIVNFLDYYSIEEKFYNIILKDLIKI